jgi:hypothetical protein
MEAKDATSTDRDSVACIICSHCRQRHGDTCYKSCVKIRTTYVRGGEWDIGSWHFLTDMPYLLYADVKKTHDLLKEKTTIPTEKILGHWEEEKGRYLTFKELARGAENLEIAWPRLSEAEREDIAQQTADFLKQLRGVQSERIEGPKGGPVYNGQLFGKDDKPYGPFSTKEQFWDTIASDLRKQGLPEKALEALGNSMPSTEPYVFTKLTFHIEDILIRDMKVVGIKDWAGAAYLPFWYGYVGLERVWGPRDGEFKTLLRPKLATPEDIGAADWYWKMYEATRWNEPGMTDNVRRIVKELEDQADSQAADTLASRLDEAEI